MAISRRPEDIREGAMVTRVQKALKNRGFDPGAVSGVFDVATESAVKQFQSKHGLAANGIVDQRTWAALGLKGPVPKPAIID
jgi:peptidoglycan hydrolase-like protein with peptidoglycan-binding domain